MKTHKIQISLLKVVKQKILKYYQFNHLKIYNILLKVLQIYNKKLYSYKSTFKLK